MAACECSNFCESFMMDAAVCVEQGPRRIREPMVSGAHGPVFRTSVRAIVRYANMLDATENAVYRAKAQVASG